jgi:thiamine pyrophosphate-dependent acetolactate synthase large subunit-like protein
MARMSAGRAVVESLIAQGVDTVFGIISVHTLDIYDALRDAVEDGRLRFIGARHEHALACMADGYARITGRPGVMLTSSGPGAADAVGALGEAYHSSVPLFHLTTEIEAEHVHSGRGVTHEAADQLGMYASITGWRAAAASAGELPGRIAEAFSHLRTSHPRPALLTVPTDLLAVEDDYEIIPARPPHPPHPRPGSIEQAAALLAGAQRPLIIAGGGAMNASAELVALAERLGAPVAAADGGKGAMPEDHPLAVGTVLGGRVWGENPVQAYANETDAVLVVGSSLPFRSTVGVGLRLPEALVQVDIDPSVFNRNYPIAVGLAGDASPLLAALTAALPAREPGPAQREAVARLRAEARASVAGQFPQEQAAWTAIRQALPREGAVFCDSTIPGYVGTRCFEALGPRTFHQPHGWVSIGWGFAASLGGAAGAGERPVVCVTGDGGFQYNTQELASAVQHGMAPTVVVFNDAAWGVLQRYQDQRFAGRRFATGLTNPDFERLAAAYGVGYTRAESVDALGEAVRASVGAQRLHLVEVPIPDGFAAFR